VAGYWLTICHPLTDYRSPSERLSDLDNSNKFVRWLLGVVLCDSLQFDEHVRYVLKTCSQRMYFSPERQSARMSKITNDGLIRFGRTGCFIAVPIWQQWASKGLKNLHVWCKFRKKKK